MSQSLTVLIPCKDEINNIANCIASARLVADEVLVADSGSTDGTLEVSRELADRVIEREYVDSGDFKNWAIPQAKHRWVMVLDADERITPELADEIKAALSASTTEAGDAEPQWLGWSVPRLNYFLGHPVKHGDWSKDRVIRLVHRDHCRYMLYTDHAEFDVPWNRVRKMQNRMVHYTAWELGPYLKKMQHYSQQQADLWYAEGRQPKLRHLVLNAPMRFLRGYILNGGFRDGMLGFQIASLTAYYSFLKQLRFWAKHRGLKQTDLETVPHADLRSVAGDESPVAESEASKSPGIQRAA